MTRSQQVAWNESIEQAACIVDLCNHEGPYNAIGAAHRIRGLKKSWDSIKDGGEEVMK